MNAVTLPLHDLRVKTKGIRTSLKSATHLPAEIYISPEIQHSEKSEIFMKKWLCVARAEEFPNPGDYTTLRIADEPVVIARDPHGELVAFPNACLHRGVEIAIGEGNSRRFTCPYHAWTYDSGGKLLLAPLMKEAGLHVDGKCIPRLKTAVWQGWLFINFDPQPQPFEEFIAPHAKSFWWYKGDECRLAYKKVTEVNCNWKFIIENLLDFYHTRTVHASTFGKQYNLGADALPAQCLPDGAFNVEFTAATRRNDPKLMFFPAIPWLAEREITVARGLIFPNMILTAGDSLRMWTAWPISPTKTRVTAHFLLPHAAFEMPDLKERVGRFEAFARDFFEEDRVVLEALQRAASSNRMDPGPLSPYEVGIHHFLNAYLDTLNI